MVSLLKLEEVLFQFHPTLPKEQEELQKKSLATSYQFSLGSLAELETQLIISDNLNYLDSGLLNGLISKLSPIRKMIFGLKKSIST